MYYEFQFGNLFLCLGVISVCKWLQDKMTASNVSRQRIDTVLGALLLAVLVFLHTEVVTFKTYTLGGISYDWVFLNIQIILFIFMAVTVSSRIGAAYLTGTLALFYWERGFFTMWRGWLSFFAVLALAYVLCYYGTMMLEHYWRVLPIAFMISIIIWYTVGLQMRGDTFSDWAINFIAFALQLLLVNAFNLRLRRDYSREMTLTKQATHDEMTGLHNFRAFSADLHDIYATRADATSYFVLVTMDIDHFKRINDTYGHLVGNDVLHQTAGALADLVQDYGAGSRAYRTGGEEFSLIVRLPEHDDQQINELCRVIQYNIRKQSLQVGNDTIHWTVSIGCNYVDQGDSGYLEVFRRADKDLYNSKENGRDAITVHGELLAE